MATMTTRKGDDPPEYSSKVTLNKEKRIEAHTRQYRWLEKSDGETHYQASRMHAGGGLVTLVGKCLV